MRMDAMSGTIPRLAFAQFYGDTCEGAEAGGFVVQEVRGIPAGGVPLHAHETPHFCFIVRGAYETSDLGLTSNCGPCTLLFHPAGTIHRDAFRTPQGSCLTVSLSDGLLETLDVPRLPSRSLGFDDADIGFPGMRMVMELRCSDRLSSLVIECLALEMIGNCLARPDKEDRSPRWLRQAREFMYEHASDPVRVRDVARAVGVHPVHLARVFRRCVGVSPVEYLRRIRVRKAIEMMGSAEGLATIAVRAGFFDQSELTKSFRREVGATPAAVRRIMGM